MVSQLRAFTNQGDYQPWMVFIPCYNIFIIVMKVPEEMTRAKQMVGVQAPSKPAWMYFPAAPLCTGC